MNIRKKRGKRKRKGKFIGDRKKVALLAFFFNFSTYIHIEREKVMLLIIAMFVYANGNVAFNEFKVDSIDEIDMNFWENFLEVSTNICGIAIYLQSETDRKRYDYYDFVSYNWIDHKSFIIDNGGFDYTYVGDDLEF